MENGVTLPDMLKKWPTGDAGIDVKNGRWLVKVLNICDFSKHVGDLDKCQRGCF